MAKKTTLISTGTIAKNRKAHFNYAVHETLTGGIVLTGAEAKALRQGKVSINEAYAMPENNEIYLLNATITEYQSARYVKQVSNRPRKLLFRRREINKLAGMVNRKGFTLVPLSLFFNEKGLAKVELALATGKNAVDKREDIKKRDWDREKHRLLKGG